MKVKLKNIEANPYRDIKNYPLDEEKLASLGESIEQTGFWRNLEGRQRTKTKVEIAYGHHRIEAARRAGLTEVEVHVEDYTNEDMLQKMARENRNEFKASAKAEVEMVRQTLNAMAGGEMKSATVDEPSNKWRQAPRPHNSTGAITPGRNQHLYTSQSLADFLGFGIDRIRQVLVILEAIDEGLFSNDDLLDSVRATYSLFNPRLQEYRRALKVPDKKARQERVKTVTRKVKATRKKIAKAPKDVSKREAARITAKVDEEEREGHFKRTLQAARQQKVEVVLDEAQVGRFGAASNELSSEVDKISKRLTKVMQTLRTVNEGIVELDKVIPGGIKDPEVTGRLQPFLETWKIRSRVLQLGRTAKQYGDELRKIQDDMDSILAGTSKQKKLTPDGGDIIIDAEYEKVEGDSK